MANDERTYIPRKKEEIFEEWWRRQGAWSIKTFGPVSHRGPVGPLKHLLKELMDELFGFEGVTSNYVLDHQFTSKGMKDIMEYVDATFLIVDAARRAGFTYEQFVGALIIKLEINEKREWPDWREKSATDAIEHDRSKEGPRWSEEDKARAQARLDAPNPFKGSR